jgi:hypothetical protein
MELPRPVHPFPARMAASIAWNTLDTHKDARRLRVLDPMAGSGTTMVIARMLGHEAIGFDTDPLAVLIAAVWCDDVDPATVMAAAERILAAAASWKSLAAREAYPVGADEECRAFVRYWFDPASRRQLAALAIEIQRVRNLMVRRLLWCAFSRLIIVKQAGASLAMDVSHSRPHRTYSKAPIRPIEHFAQNVKRVLAASPFSQRDNARPPARIAVGDARALKLESGSVDVVITSPPYLNAIDYMRGHRLSLVWMRHSIDGLRAIRSGNIGTEAGRSDSPNDDDLVRAFGAGTGHQELSPADAGMFTRYLRDIRKVLCEISRVLCPGGLAVLVVGESTLGGSVVSNSAAIRVLAEAQGIRLIGSQTRDLPMNRRYLPPPESRRAGQDLGRRLKQEVLLSFRCP